MTKPPKERSNDDTNPEEVVEQNETVRRNTLEELIERFNKQKPEKK